MRRSLEFSALIGLLLSGCGCNQDSGSQTFKADVIVYGGTSSAVTTAVQVQRMGRTVIIVSPDKHLGGLSSSGLGFTDTGNKEVIGGLAREFYQFIYSHYEKPESWKWQKRSDYGNRGQGSPAIDGEKRTMWIFEPHVAKENFGYYLNEAGINVLYQHRLVTVKKENGVIKSITIEHSGKPGSTSYQVIKAKVFIDCSYEGDLMAMAGVSYFTGRESNDLYHETYNGVQLLDKHQFPDGVDPYKIPGKPESG